MGIGAWHTDRFWFGVEGCRVAFTHCANDGWTESPGCRTKTVNCPRGPSAHLGTLREQNLANKPRYFGYGKL